MALRMACTPAGGTVLSRRHPIVPDGTIVNGCEVLAAHENNTYKVKCGRCGTIFFPKRSFIARRVIKSCGCYQKRIHTLVCVQAFHNYGGKKNRP